MLDNSKGFLVSVLSTQTGDLADTIKQLTQKYVQLWWQTPASLPSFFKTYNPNEQEKIEKEISRVVEQFFAYMEQYLALEDVNGIDFSEPIDQAKAYLKKLSELTGIHLNHTFVNGFIRSTQLFIDKVNRFDPAMAPENIYQALRNIWTTNTIQNYMYREIGCSDSMFAYSMIYPYTDNVMDDVSMTQASKIRFSENLKHRLEGQAYPRDCSETEKKLDALVSLVEEQFPRVEFPDVFQSLLGIYNAQAKSLIQQEQDVSPYVIDVLGISFEKGGTSVLADGYLVNGHLDKTQQDYCFALGTFLQLADDIQDILMDKKNNHMTLFSQVTGKYPLDAIANKLFHYISLIVENTLGNPSRQDLKKLLHKSFYFHIMEAVGKNRELYSNQYIKNLEAHFPFRFRFLKKLRKKLGKLHLKQKQRTPDIRLDIISSGLLALTSRVYE
jgi:hypothetical protein